MTFGCTSVHLMRAPRVAVGIVLALGLSLAACGGVDLGALSGKSPSQVLSATLAAAKGQKTVHYKLVATSGSSTQTITGDASQTGGVQTVSNNSNASITVEVIGTAAYLQGNAGGLQSTIGMSAANATKYAGQWISVASSDSLYQPITQAVTIPGIVNQLLPHGNLAAQSATSLDGHDVVPIKGGLPGGATAGVTGTATLYVLTGAPTLPLAFTGLANENGHTVNDQGVFSHWDEVLSLTPPAGAVAFSSIPKS